MQCQEAQMQVSEAEQTKPDWFYSDSVYSVYKGFSDLVSKRSKSDF